MIFAKPKKTKGEAEKSDVKGESSSKSTQSELKSPDRSKSSQSELGFASNRSQSELGVSSNRAQSELGFASGLDAKKSKSGPADRFNKSIENKDDSPKKPVDKTKGGLFAREEIENTTVVINENIGEMIGIDGKIYGPFLENDVVILPNINAQILIDNNKASLVKL
jgi:DNA replication factor GINS